MNMALEQFCNRAYQDDSFSRSRTRSAIGLSSWNLEHRGEDLITLGVVKPVRSLTDGDFRLGGISKVDKRCSSPAQG